MPPKVPFHIHRDILNKIASMGTGDVATDPIWDAKGDLAVGTGANTASRLAVGADGLALVADSVQATGLKWAAVAGSVATDAIWDAKGDLAVGTGANTASKLVVGADGQVLYADSAQATGIKWAAAGAGDVANDVIWDAKGDLAAGTGANTAAKVTVGADGKYLKADSGQATGLTWDTPAGNVAADAIWDAKGDLAAGTGANTAAKVTVGTDGKYLKADSGQATGLAWDNPGDVLWSVIQASQLVNEIKYWPARVPNDSDLVTLNLWWDTIGTPTTAATFVDVAGEAGITETWEYCLKCVGDAVGEGFYQRYTYVDEPRVKLGRTVSAIAAVWVKTAGTIVTMALTTSVPTSVTATANAQAWTIIKCEGLVLDGTYVDLKFTTDTADTFYVVPLGMCIGTKAVPLGPRPERRVEITPAVLVNGVDPGASWTDVDCTATVGNLAFRVFGTGHYYNNTTANTALHVRRNGSAEALGLGNEVARVHAPGNVYAYVGQLEIELDDGNIFEYIGSGVAGDDELCWLSVAGYWEWG